MVGDGDTMSTKPVMTKEANEECKLRINSIGYYVTIEGKTLRPQEKDFALTVYNVTRVSKDVKLSDINTKSYKYAA